MLPNRLQIERVSSLCICIGLQMTLSLHVVMCAMPASSLGGPIGNAMRKTTDRTWKLGWHSHECTVEGVVASSELQCLARVTSVSPFQLMCGSFRLAFRFTG